MNWHRPGQMAGKNRTVTTGVVTGGGNGTALQVRVDGETHDRVTHPGGVYLAPGTSVTVLRLGQGRYQVLGMGGHWAPIPS